MKKGTKITTYFFEKNINKKMEQGKKRFFRKNKVGKSLDGQRLKNGGKSKKENM